MTIRVIEPALLQSNSKATSIEIPIRMAAVGQTTYSHTIKRQQGFTLVELLVALVVMVIMTGLSWKGMDVMLRSGELTQTRVDEISSLQTAVRQWNADLDAIFPVAMNGAAAVVLNSFNNSPVPIFSPTLNATPAVNGAVPQRSPQVMSVDWDGRVLKILRRSSTPTPNGADGGLNVVGWTVRDNMWVRWQSPELNRTTDLVNAWEQVTLWAQNPSSDSAQFETSLMPSGGWQIYYFRENAWSNALSSAGTNPVGMGAQPNGVQGVGGTNAYLAGTYLPDAIRMEIELPPSLGGSLVKDWVRPSYSANRS